MSLPPQDCCVLNSGNGAWAFEPLATRLSSFLKIDISDQPRRFNYLLQIEQDVESIGFNVFIPLKSLQIAADKRLLASLFNQHNVPTPQTNLFDSFQDALSFVRENSNTEWCLKFPTSCGANGHRMLETTSSEPSNWPRSFIVQEFIRLERPEVYRTYCAGGELFGWVARRFPEGAQMSSWVAHARGARYAILGEPPLEALQASRSALEVTGLLHSFGCVDLLRRPTGEWLVLEVGTDGMFNHVDRDIGDPDLEDEIYRRIASAFWKAAGSMF